MDANIGRYIYDIIKTEYKLSYEGKQCLLARSFARTGGHNPKTFPNSRDHSCPKFREPGQLEEFLPYNGLMFTPNTDSHAIRFLIYLNQGADLFEAYLVRVKRGQHAGKVELISVCTDLFIEDLNQAIDAMYDEYIKEVQHGFISV